VSSSSVRIPDRKRVLTPFSVGVLILAVAVSRVPGQDTASGSYAGKPLAEWVATLRDNVELDTDAGKEQTRKAAHALGQIGVAARGAVPLLAKTLQSRSVEAREAAVDSLGRIGPAANSAVPAILTEADLATDHVDYKTLANFRRLAAKTLGRIGPDAKAAVPMLERALKNEDLVYRVEAALALWRVVRHKDALPALTALLKQPAVEGPYQAAMAIGEIGPDAKETADALVQALRHPQPDVRRAAAKVLVPFGPAVLPAVAQALAAEVAAPPQASVPEAAAYALGELLGQLRENVVYNRQLTQAQFTESALPALRVAAPPLVKLLGHPRPEARQDAARALAQMGIPAAMPLLAPLASSNATEREATLDTLVRLEQYLPRESPSSPGVERIKQTLVPKLLPFLDDNDPKVRAGACRVLSEFSIGAALSAAAPNLRNALKDSDVAVRHFASKALEQVQAAEK
jgi:HEAT repeat protein